MFAYCANNLVNCSDQAGCRPIWERNYGNGLIGYSDSGSPGYTTGTGNAKPYFELPENDNPYLANCYAYALYYPFNLQPGMLGGEKPTNYADVECVFDSVTKDLNTKGITVRRIKGANSPVFSTERRIALRVGTSPYNKGIPPYAYTPQYDYHFMFQVDDGRWAEKHGYGGASVIHGNGENPDNLSWDLGEMTGYYNSPIIYFAIDGG